MGRLVQSTWKVLVVLVGVSAALRAWAGDSVRTPWIAPDEEIYAELGRSFWNTGHFAVLGRPAALFSAVYPVFAGLPLSMADAAQGYDLLKGLQAVVMSLTAVPVYLWGRELVSRRWALVAAALALAPPSLAYSGLIMTEVAFYPVFVVAAWAVARAIAVPAPRRQALALGATVLVSATRLQGMLFLPAYLTAAAFDAAMFRDARRLRAHARVAGGLALLALLWTGWQLRHGGPATKVLGAYQAAGESGYSVWDALRFVVYHLGDLVLISGVAPFCALTVLVVIAVRHREADARVRAFLATAVSLSLWMSVEVGVFASRHIGHLAERNLFPLVPLLGLALVVWLARGAPRPRTEGLAAAVLALVLLVAVPVEAFTTLAATPSAFTQIPLYELTNHVNLDLVVPLAAAVLLAGCAFASRRTLAVGVPVLLLALGTAASVSASRFVAAQSRYVDHLTFDRGRSWIEPRADGRVTYLYTDYLNWVTVWENRFWNPSLVRVYDLLTAQVPGGIPQTSVGPYENGKLVFADGRPARSDYVLAAASIGLAGEQLGANAGLVLWRVEPPLRLVRWMTGVDVYGNVPSGRAEMRVYACTGGALTGTILAREPRSFEVLRNGDSYRVFAVQPGAGRPFDVPVSVPKPAGQRLCTITLRADGPFSIRGLNFG